MITTYYDDVQNTRITADHRDVGDQYKYDGAKRLVSVLRGVATQYIGDSFASNLSNNRYSQFGEFKYDQTGNRVTQRLNGSDDVIYTHDKANQISTEAGSAVSHDQAGNYTGASNAFRYTWNNQLGVYIKAGSPNVTHTWHFDALGRKVEWNDGTREHHFYYDGQQIVELAEVTSGSETGRKLQIWGERIDDLVVYRYLVPDPDVNYYAHQDHLGSVAILVESDGDIAEGYRYVEWGQTTIVDSSFAKLTVTEGDLKNNVRYAGRDQYTALGDNVDTWYNNRARALRTKWGRFVERDPAHYEYSSNLFTYVNSGPLSHIDPFGADITDCPFGGEVQNQTGNDIVVHGDAWDGSKKEDSLAPGQWSDDNGWCDADSVLFCCGSNCKGFTVPGGSNCAAKCENGEPVLDCDRPGWGGWNPEPPWKNPDGSDFEPPQAPCGHVGGVGGGCPAP